MRKTLALLVASTALTATVGLPAWSAMNASADIAAQPFTTVLADGSQPLPLVLASDDDDDDDHGKRDSVKRGHNDDDDHDDDDDDDDDDVYSRSNARNPAPAGTVAPPSNGLFGNGTPPKVQMN